MTHMFWIWPPPLWLSARLKSRNEKASKYRITWGVAQGGTVSHNPDEILYGGGGYKGYGMGSLVEIFCGILGGAHWGPNIRKWMTAEEDADLGQCFIAIDPEAFAPGFNGRMQEFMDTMRNLPSVDPAHKVLIPGDPEKAHEKVVDELGGIPYHPNQIVYAVSGHIS
ncbi:malate/L-lactate dehydrogenase [Ostertagia ostertagi]